MDTMTTQDECCCRYCLKQDIQENLLSPCNCKGSAQFVHESCLTKWQQSRPKVDDILDYFEPIDRYPDPGKYDPRRSQCEVCRAVFPGKWHKKMKLRMRWSIRNVYLKIAVCSLIIFNIFCFLVSLFRICFLYSHKESQETGDTIFFHQIIADVIDVAIFMACCVVVCLLILVNRCPLFRLSVYEWKWGIFTENSVQKSPMFSPIDGDIV